VSEHQSKIKLRTQQIEDAERFVRVFLTEDGGPHAGRCCIVGIAFDDANNARVGVLPNVNDYRMLGAVLVQMGNDILQGKSKFSSMPIEGEEIEGEVEDPAPDKPLN
jgi:hypothetical protein